MSTTLYNERLLEYNRLTNKAVLSTTEKKQHQVLEEWLDAMDLHWALEKGELESCK